MYILHNTKRQISDSDNIINNNKTKGRHVTPASRPDSHCLYYQAVCSKPNPSIDGLRQSSPHAVLNEMAREWGALTCAQRTEIFTVLKTIPLTKDCSFCTLYF